MSRYFVVYREGRRLRAALSQFGVRPEAIEFNGQSFAAIGSFIHLSHIVDRDLRLLGFAVDGIDNVTKADSWSGWWKSVENVDLEDFWQAYIRLADPWPSDWFPDTALLPTGGVVLYGGHGEYVLALPDENDWALGRQPPFQFWKEIAFELSPVRVR